MLTRQALQPDISSSRPVRRPILRILGPTRLDGSRTTILMDMIRLSGLGMKSLPRTTNDGHLNFAYELHPRPLRKPLWSPGEKARYCLTHELKYEPWTAADRLPQRPHINFETSPEVGGGQQVSSIAITVNYYWRFKWMHVIWRPHRDFSATRPESMGERSCPSRNSTQEGAQRSCNKGTEPGRHSNNISGTQTSTPMPSSYNKTMRSPPCLPEMEVASRSRPPTQSLAR